MRADAIVDVSAEMDTIVAMLACHASQCFDWLPYNLGILDQLPSDAAGRLDWLGGWYASVVRQRAERYRDLLTNRGAATEFIEMFEISEYARPLDAGLRARLFGEL